MYIALDQADLDTLADAITQAVLARLDAIASQRPPADETSLLTRAQAASELGISIRTLDAYVRSQSITPTRIGSRVLFGRADIAAFVAKSKPGAAPTQK